MLIRDLQSELTVFLCRRSEDKRSISFTGSWGADMQYQGHQSTAQITGQCQLNTTPIAGLPKQLGWDDASF